MSEDTSNNDPTSVVDPNATEPTSDVGAWGGKRAGSGRPKGSKNQFSKHSVDRLKELEFDPMGAMVELFHDTHQMILEMDDSKHPRRYSAQAMASLIITKQKLINDLMRYGYRHVPEKIETEITERKPLTINLTGLAAPETVIEPEDLIEDSTYPQH